MKLEPIVVTAEFDAKAMVRKLHIDLALELIESLVDADPAGRFLLDAQEALEQYARSVKP